MKKHSPANGTIRVGVVQFPGSNCDDDCVDVVRRHFDFEVFKIWYQLTELPKLNAMIIPGGFSFGDYLRSGALAAHAPIMRPIKEFANRGGAVLGICNGFQILTESGLLPGALLQNRNMEFICRTVHLKSASNSILSMPIAHGEGRYWIDENNLSELEDKSRIAFRYCNEQGLTNQTANPNGSVANIAGVYSENKKILGMMPHPERASDCLMGGSSDGLKVLSEFFNRV